VALYQITLTTCFSVALVHSLSHHRPILDVCGDSASRIASSFKIFNSRNCLLIKNLPTESFVLTDLKSELAGA